MHAVDIVTLTDMTADLEKLVKRLDKSNKLSLLTRSLRLGMSVCIRFQNIKYFELSFRSLFS
jgi:hypothetical protein